MGDEGAKHFADMLKINQTLTSVEYAATCPISYCHHPLTPYHHLKPVLHSLK